jgi:hypothetical protein
MNEKYKLKIKKEKSLKFDWKYIRIGWRQDAGSIVSELFIFLCYLHGHCG